MRDTITFIFDNSTVVTSMYNLKFQKLSIASIYRLIYCRLKSKTQAVRKISQAVQNRSGQKNKNLVVQDFFSANSRACKGQSVCQGSMLMTNHINNQPTNSNES